MKRFLILINLVWLSACSTPQIASLNNDELFEHSFARAGRFSMTIYRPEAQGVQGGFTWLDNNQNFRLELLNPFGTVMAQLSLTQTQAKLIDNQGNITTVSTADSLNPAEQLLQSILGEPLPIQAIRAWIQGKVDPNLAIEQAIYNDANQLQTLQQNQWIIHFDQYDIQGPTKLRLSHKSPSREILIRLIIESN